MTPGRIIKKDSDIQRMLEENRTIAILGLSPKPERDSNRVARYLMENGFRIIPVRPGQSEILGEKAFASLDLVREPVGIVNVFRNPHQEMEHAREAVRMKPKAFWMQLGIEHPDAARLLTESGIDVVMNRCIKIEHTNCVRKVT